MKEKKKENSGLMILVVILLLACVGMGAFILMNKDKLNSQENTKTTVDRNSASTEESTGINADIFKDETIHAYYYETKQEGTMKYFMTLGNMTKDNIHGYFTIRYVSVYESGSEASLVDGYFDNKDGQLKLSVGPYSSNKDQNVAETIFKNLAINLEIDPEQDWRDSKNSPSYYKMITTTYNENEIIIGNQTFYRVK